MSATDELRRMLDERGVEYATDDNNASNVTMWTTQNGGWAFDCDYMEPLNAKPGTIGAKTELMIYGYTPEQAVEATLGSELPYDELLRCLENDWNISASWDGLRKFWCIELTEEGVKLRNSAQVTLTAEQVREAIFHGSVYASYDGAQYYANGIGMKAIADELNATICAGTCKVESMHGYTDAFTHTSYCVELSCHTLDAWEDSIPPSYCPICGARVVE